jgi:hypothetical protein
LNQERISYREVAFGLKKSIGSVKAASAISFRAAFVLGAVGAASGFLGFVLACKVGSV